MISTLEKEIAFRYLKTRKKDGFLNIISIFSFIGISLGVAVLIIVMSVMNGFRTELINKIVGFNSHVTVKPYDKPIDIKKLNNNDLKLISNELILTNTGEAVVINKDYTKGIVLRGYSKKDFVKMGSYGVGVSRLVGAIIEAKYNEKDEVMKWPLSVAPYEVAVIPLINKNETSNLEKAKNIYNVLKSKNIDVILDDTDENFSSKMKKFNLIGAPYQILLGKKSSGDLVEFIETGKDSQNLSLEQIVKVLTEQKEKI